MSAPSSNVRRRVPARAPATSPAAVPRYHAPPTPADSQLSAETPSRDESPDESLDTRPAHGADKTAKGKSRTKAKDHDGAATVTTKPKTRKRRNTFIFLLGGLCGIVAAGFFAKSNDLIGFPEIGDLSMESLLDIMPAGLVRDMRDLVVGLPLPIVLAATN